MPFCFRFDSSTESQPMWRNNFQFQCEPNFLLVGCTTFRPKRLSSFFENCLLNSRDAIIFRIVLWKSHHAQDCPISLSNCFSSSTNCRRLLRRTGRYPIVRLHQPHLPNLMQCRCLEVSSGPTTIIFWMHQVLLLFYRIRDHCWPMPAFFVETLDKSPNE